MMQVQAPSANPFSKKRRLDEISNSAVTEKQQQQPASVNTTYYDAKSHEGPDVSVYHSVADDSKMEVDTPVA